MGPRPATPHRKHHHAQDEDQQDRCEAVPKTGTGKLRRLQQNRQHLFEKKPSTRTRRLDGMVDVHPGDAKKIKRLLGER